MTYSSILKKTVLGLVLSCPVCVLMAQNPIINNQFSADPTARVFDGKLYLFPSHDIISPVEPEKKWFSMEDYHMFSSDNLVDWEDHGVILSQDQVPWGNPKGYAMWAPDCVQKDGKYYFYFPDAPAEGEGFRIGVAIADNLKDHHFVAEKHFIEGVVGIDPVVLQASDGTNMIFWGNGGKLYQAELNADLLSIKGEAQEVPGLPEGFKEGPFAFEKDGHYYLTYPWVRTEGGTECLAYAMSDKPMGPYTYQGIIMKEHPNKCWTNHHSIVKFKGQWYLFYHHNDYSPSFDKNRSVCVDYLSFSDNGSIQEVTPSYRGVGVTDGRKQIQIDRYSMIGGRTAIAYLDEQECMKGWETQFPSNGWLTYDRVDLGTKPPTGICLRIKDNGATAMELMIGDERQRLSLPDTEGEWKEVSLDLKSAAKGIKDLRITCLQRKVSVDWIQFK